MIQFTDDENKFHIKDGIIFVPRFVKQKSDLQYGETVTHENYNEKLNLNTTQGDYNTEILRLLFTDANPAHVPHIKYLDKIIEDEVNRIDDILKEHQEYLEKLDKDVEKLNERVDSIDNVILEIIDGTKKVGHALKADAIAGVEDVDPHYYYGTDYDGNVGFHKMPDAIYAEDIDSSDVDIAGIHYTPRDNSVAESMLTPEVRNKLNRKSITDYDELTSRPKINNTLLTGNLSLSDLGIQPIGNYLTSIPEEYITDEELISTLANYLTITDAANIYATKTQIDDLIQNITDVRDDYARVFIGTVPTGVTPKNGDLLISI